MPKEKKLFQMAASSRNNSGFTLVEILLYISFYGLVMALLIPVSYTHLDVYKRQGLKQIFESFSGDTPVYLHLIDSGKMIKVERCFWVDGKLSLIHIWYVYACDASGD